jgi:adenosylcobinamide-GDP ribazoletransferase
MILAGLRTAWRFLTIIPIGRSSGAEADFARSLAFFPLVGLILGVVLAGFQMAVSRVLPGSVVDLGCILLLVVLTGGLHLDGLSDTADALGGGSREKALAIMKETAVGVFGVFAVFAVLSLKVVCLLAVPLETKPWALALLPVMGRWAMVLLATTTPYARPDDGTGKAFVGYAPTWIPGIAAIMTMSLAAALMGWAGLVAGVATFAGAMVLRQALLRWLGGVTGDTLGAASEGAEVLALLIWVATK